jgi:crossover junction endodeoxyribonuclease RuvC
MRIIGIDPGYDRVGISIVEKISPKEKEVLVHSECFTTSPKTEIYDRLSSVGLRIRTLIQEFRPNALAMETLFITKNQKTAMHVSEARGIIAYEARLNDIPIFEYSPPQIKIAVTGYGKSDKPQVIKMIPLLLKMPPEKLSGKMLDDEYDAIAVALTCIASEKNSEKISAKKTVKN